MHEQIHIFDRSLVRRHRDRAAAHFAAHHRVLHEEVSSHILDRLVDVKRDFSTALDLGSHDGLLAQQLAHTQNRFVVACDVSEPMLQNVAHSCGMRPSPVLTGGAGGGLGDGGSEIDQPPPNPPRKRGGNETWIAESKRTSSLVADEELLPFASDSFDLIVSNLSLHWVNDLPGTLAQIKRTLKPDGLFLAALLGGQTLIELRTCLLEAELAVTAGVSPRLSPSIDMQSASALLQRAGFSLPVTDHEILTLAYSDIYALMRDLRGMGETNAHAERSRKPTRRKVFETANRLYKERFALPDGRLPATFDVIFVHGWR